MNYKLYSVISFVTGAAIGSLVTWKIVKTRYEQIAQEEIESVKEHYAKRAVLNNSLDEVSAGGVDKDKIYQQAIQASGKSYEKPDIMEYSARLKEFGYAAELADEDDDEEDYDEDYYEEEDEEDMDGDPYVISPDEFDENGYETESLTYYADGVLTNSYDEIVEDVDDVVGIDSLDHFGEYEDDSVFVRNDSRKTDYEILRDYRTYAEAHSHSAEE